MFCNAINKNQINIFSGHSDLYFNMRKVGFLVFTLVEHVCFDLAFSAVTQLCSRCPFVVIQELMVRFEMNDIVLS